MLTTKLKRGFAIAAALVAALVLGSCASTPEAGPERDAEAKQFNTHPDAATIYVYRSPHNRIDSDSVLYIDGRLIGSTVPGTYFRIDTVPGHHVLHGVGVDVGYFGIDARPGQLYFVSLDVVGGHSNFRLVREDLARERVRACCAMLEVWAPNQRPFLR